MPPTLPQRLRRRWLPLLCMALLIIGLPTSCAVLQYKERQLVFRIEPGTAGWFHGLPQAVQELELKSNRFRAGQNLHAWWWPAQRADAPAILYLHGVRWNLTGQLFRIEQLHALGYSVLAIDYRGFGQSHGELPSEASVYEDARVAWERLKVLQPEAGKRLIYGHSLGGAVAIDLAAELGRQAANEQRPVAARGLIVESTFTTLADAAVAVTKTRLPVRWVMSQKFDSIDKISEIGMPLLVVHGLKDDYVPARLSQQLFAAALPPKKLLLVPGGTHNNSMNLAGKDYAVAIGALLKHQPATGLASQPSATRHETL
ncbi:MULTISPECIES: alpha/beta hydrolase [Pseudomonas]|uniref:Alpha/beta hydrolase n=1 Tax=Pseudomonas sessilinigenes TaxID=658629 RepID=A0ABX8ML46_9PSED|nr:MULTISPECIES: alpha/beta hydrolase [Pseudomonas]AZC27122.1 putative exported protein [Pseudomonas sessilinigenes]QIH07534.1 alpha/beta hydrolase [Pseudomonas sp. BIOMIG1BAC]QXH38934.1 alpha/beta hydrolase [Pseudomonas sessilinigenes]